jgi:hypothetical protein
LDPVSSDSSSSGEGRWWISIHGFTFRLISGVLAGGPGVRGEGPPFVPTAGSSAGAVARNKTNPQFWHRQSERPSHPLTRLTLPHRGQSMSFGGSGGMIPWVWMDDTGAEPEIRLSSSP